MEQMTITSTLDKIQELINSNSGDTGRLNHIIDFINNEKPLYKTDKIYLEKKLNSKVVIPEKKIIPKEENIQNKIKKLMEIYIWLGFWAPPPPIMGASPGLGFERANIVNSRLLYKFQ